MQQSSPETAEKLKQLCLTAIKENDIKNITDIALYIPYSRQSVYCANLHNDFEIRDALNFNRMKVKEGMRKKWVLSDNPVLQISAYKLYADEDELRRLNNKHDNSGGTELPKIQLILETS